MNKPVSTMTLDELLYAQRDLTEVIVQQEEMQRAELRTPKLAEYLDDLYAVSAELLKRKNPPKTMAETEDLRENLRAMRVIRTACREMLDAHNSLASALDVYGDAVDLPRRVVESLEESALQLPNGCKGAVALAEALQVIETEMAAILDRLN